MAAIRIVAILAMGMLALAASAHAAEKLPNVYAALESSPDFSVLKLAVDTAGLADTLKDPKLAGTIFAPTNAAFGDFLAKIGLNPKAALANKALVTAVLQYHVLPAAYKAADFKPHFYYKTLLRGASLRILTSNGTAFVEAYASKAKVLVADLEAPAAVVHVLDRVLIPKVGPYTGCRTVASLVAGSTRLKSLLAAVQAAGLDGVLARPGFVGTVLAPTDAAFAKLLKALNTTLPELAKNKKLLTSVLLYHIIPARVYASNIDNHTKAFTLAVLPLKFKTNSGVTVIGRGSSAKVIKADIFACKAVVHIINNVLLPIKATGK